MTEERQFSDYLVTFGDDLHRLRQVMRANLSSDVSLISEMENDYLIGGKRVRAIVALLSARLCGLDEKTGDIIAAATEFIHTATLLHDDVVDDSNIRRHQPAARRVYGNAAAVLAGDFLYSRASQLFAQLNNTALLQCVATATNRLAEGEILQLLNRGKPNMDEDAYFAIIRRKTASLFEIAAAAAAHLTGRDAAPLLQYGGELGVTFQLVDDCLDYASDADATGKKIGADFAEGKMTLPAILMLKKMDDANRDRLLQQWSDGRGDSFTDMLRLVRDTGALDDALARARARAQRAADALSNEPPSAARDTLINLALASWQRQA